MKQLIIKSNKYKIYEVDSLYLREIATFVVNENYKHHHSTDTSKLNSEIESVYQEELIYAKSAHIFIVENNSSAIIGSIRVMKWNMRNKLPMQKIFGINPLDHITTSNVTTFWHIGRFAISTCSGISCGTLFKQLMIYAIYPICKEKDGYMIAECDSKLLRTMSLLGIDTVSLSKGIYYLSSETIPVYANKAGLEKFYRNFSYLHHKVSNAVTPIEAA